MRRSIKVLLFAVAVPGALSSVLYAALTEGDDDRGARAAVSEPLRIEVREAVEVAVPEVRVQVEVDEDEARARARAVVVRSAPRCASGTERTLALDADPADLLRVEAGSGDLEVEGVAGLDEVQVVALLCASDEDRLAGLDVLLERRGEGIELETRYPSWEGGGGGRAYARIDLRVQVPRGLATEIEDSSGGMRLAGVGSLTIDDSSGEIEVTGADGDVRIDDSSGEITLADVAGDVEIQDGSGEIEVRDVQGSVLLADGSGSIEVRDVERDVRIPRDGSGSIEVHEVGGDFVVERDGSGGIRFTGVRGRVDVPRKR